MTCIQRRCVINQQCNEITKKYCLIFTLRYFYKWFSFRRCLACSTSCCNASLYCNVMSLYHSSSLHAFRLCFRSRPPGFSVNDDIAEVVSCDTENILVGINTF